MDNPKHLDMDATLAAGQEVTGDDIVYVAFVEDYGTVQMQGVTHSQAQVAWADSSDWADTSVLGSGVPPYNVDETTVTTVDGDWQSQFAKAFIQGIESAEAEMDRRIKAEYVQFVVWNDNDLLKSVNVTYVIDGNSYIVPARWDDTAKKFVAYVPDAVTNLKSLTAISEHELAQVDVYGDGTYGVHSETVNDVAVDSSPVTVTVKSTKAIANNLPATEYEVEIVPVDLSLEELQVRTGDTPDVYPADYITGSDRYEAHIQPERADYEAVAAMPTDKDKVI